MKYIAALLSLFLTSSCNTQNKSQTVSRPNDFDSQFKIFESLGYQLNEGITKEIILKNMQEDYPPNTDLEEEFKKQEFELLYYYLGWSYSYPPLYYTNNCIWYDIEFIDTNSEYITFMERMGAITQGELNFSEIFLYTDNENYEWIDFKVNGVHKKWKLAKAGYVSDAFFQRFSDLPEEFNTSGKYTCYTNGGQQFVIDYATEEEQELFIEKTGLKREWLGEKNQFSAP